MEQRCKVTFNGTSRHFIFVIRSNSYHFSSLLFFVAVFVFAVLCSSVKIVIKHSVLHSLLLKIILTQKQRRFRSKRTFWIWESFLHILADLSMLRYCYFYHNELEYTYFPMRINKTRRQFESWLRTAHSRSGYVRWSGGGGGGGLLVPTLSTMCATGGGGEGGGGVGGPFK